MARLVLHERNGPYVIKVGNEEVYLCGCGLSANKPYCDDSHEKTLDEKDGVYFYDSNYKRVKMDNFYSNE